MTVPRTMIELLTRQERRLTLLERRLAVRGGVPARLGPAGAVVTDLNDATETGWYSAERPANAPNNSSAPFLVTVTVSGEGTYPGRILQEATLNTSDVQMRRGRWSRWFRDGSWSPWRQTATLSGMLTIGSSAGAVFLVTPVTFPTGFFLAPPNIAVGSQVNTSGTSLISQAISVTEAGFSARTATTTAAAWGSTYTVPWIAVPDPV